LRQPPSHGSAWPATHHIHNGEANILCCEARYRPCHHRQHVPTSYYADAPPPLEPYQNLHIRCPHCTLYMCRRRHTHTYISTPFTLFSSIRRTGRIPGIYKSWKECEKQTKGHANEYKSFKVHPLNGRKDGSSRRKFTDSRRKKEKKEGHEGRPRRQEGNIRRQELPFPSQFHTATTIFTNSVLPPRLEKKPKRTWNRYSRNRRGGRALRAHTCMRVQVPSAPPPHLPISPLHSIFVLFRRPRKGG
jgi:hypothetical protein